MSLLFITTYIRSAGKHVTPRENITLI